MKRIVLVGILLTTFTLSLSETCADAGQKCKTAKDCCTGECRGGVCWYTV